MVWSTAPTKRFFGLLIAIQQSVELQRWNWSLGRHSGAGSTANSTMLLPSRLTSGSERGDLPRAGLLQLGFPSGTPVSRGQEGSAPWPLRFEAKVLSDFFLTVAID